MIPTPHDTSGLIMNNPAGNSGVIVRELGMKASGFAHIARLLRKDTYSDPILAPIREYSTNAVDAHVEAGCANRPIVVKLPNSLSPVFAVRDFGPGMSEDRVWEIFTNFGESTKRGTNDQVGMLGIGSKSGLAYSDTFTIVNFHGGKKSVYFCSIAGGGAGTLTRVVYEDTTEASGLEIQIPVLDKDIDTFVSRATDFFRHWEVMPIFEGVRVDIKPIEKLYSGDNWYFAKDSTTPYIIMGNISYPLSFYNLKCDSYSDEGNAIKRMFERGLVVRVNIGDVDISMSRESLQYTDKTIASILALSKTARQELENMVKAEFDTCATMFQKKLLYNKFNDFSSPLYVLSFLSRSFDHIHNRYSLAKDTGIILTKFARGYRGKRRVKGTDYTGGEIECDEDIQYVLWNDPTEKRPLNRITALIEKADNVFKKTYKSVYLIEVVDQAEFDKWSKEKQFDIPLVDFTSLPVVKTSDIYLSQRTASTTTYVYSPKNSKKMLVLDMDASARKNSDYFKIEDIADTGELIPYIVIDRYKIGGQEPWEFISMVKHIFKALGVTIPPIAAVKESYSMKVDADLYTPFREYMKDLIEENDDVADKLLEIYKFQKMNNLSIDNGYSEGSISQDVIKHLRDNVSKMTDTTGVAYTFLSGFPSTDKDTLAAASTNLVTLETMVGKLIENEVTAFEKVFNDNTKKFTEAYPMLNWLESYRVGRCVSANNAVIDYINMVDVHAASTA